LLQEYSPEEVSDWAPLLFLEAVDEMQEDLSGVVLAKSTKIGERCPNKAHEAIGAESNQLARDDNAAQSAKLRHKGQLISCIFIWYARGNRKRTLSLYYWVDLLRGEHLILGHELLSHRGYCDETLEHGI
jgi:hypothetical protein